MFKLTTVFLFACILQTISGCEQQQAEMQWNCAGTGVSSMQCELRNTGNAAGAASFDIAVVCSDGDHLAHVDTGMIQPGGIKQKVVTNFSPEISAFTECQGTEYRNQKVRLQ